MARPSRAEGVLFWFMVALGGALLAPSLILPAWLEYQASLDLQARWAEQIARHEADLTRLQKQREHLKIDDAYALRLAHEQLNLETPGAERIPVEPGIDTPSEPASGPESRPAAGNEELAPELSALVERLMQEHPVTTMFVRAETRPILLFLGGGLILSALLLLGGSGRRAAG